MNKKLIKKVKDSFLNQFKKKPILVFSPGRINLIGEHTDYNEGFVFPAAINKGIIAGVQKSDSNFCKAIALNKSDSYEFKLNNLKSLKNGGWKNYILGVVFEIRKLDLKLGNFNLVFAGDIPEGAGMSSSAALENSIVFALNEVFNLGLSKRKMIIISQKAEHNYVGVKCGIMDQYSSMFGEKNSVLLLDCRKINSISFKIDFNDHKLILINTNVKHQLSESAYNNRRIVCENISKSLKIRALRDATENDLNKLIKKIPNEDYKKALYVIQENKRVKETVKAINNKNLKMIGLLLYQSHEGLKNLYKVSCDELDFLVDQTKDNPYILGARMMGGGFGGCTINLIKKSEVKNFKKETLKAYLKEFNKNCSFYSIKLSEGTCLIK